jgi:hypothetical protein
MWLQYDGAPPLFGRTLTDILNEDYDGRWMGRGEPVAWHAWSPVLNALDFFLWGCMKSRVYHGGKPEARHQLVLAIHGAAFGVRNELGRMQLQCSIAKRLAACMQHNYGHFGLVL